MSADPITIPGYTVHGELGKGGMATVYLATQESLRRKVAIKVLDDSQEGQLDERFINEAHLIASLNHPRIITIYDISRLDDGRYYIAMEFVAGGHLKEQAPSKCPTYALGVVRQVAKGLEEVHAKGVVHRDIKPANILFNKDGSVVLTDFGIAKDLAIDTDITQTGISVGSPSYSSPEQAQCDDLDHRTDIYSLGVVLLELLTGNNPFKGDSHTATVMNHLHMPLPALPANLFKYKYILSNMLAKEPKDRFNSCTELLEALDEAIEAEINSADDLEDLDDIEKLDSLEKLEDLQDLPHLPDLLDVKGIEKPQELEDLEDATQTRVVAEKASSKISYRLPLVIFSVVLFISIGVYTKTFQKVETFFKVSIHVVKAEIRFKEGKLITPNNDNARYYYQQALLLDKDNSIAQGGLKKVITKQIESYLQLGNNRINKLQLMLPKNNNAVFYFRKVLHLKSENSQAKAGLHRVVEKYIQLAKRSFDEKRYSKGLRYIERGLEIEADNTELLKLKKDNIIRKK